ncbi:hypothetical protein QP556_24525, partial [Citrobacter freundii]|uniref:hypothetical protein n=1 Tax=Citrobacter freundii TaxID=546 RepID=UPI00254BDC3B
MGSCAAPSAKGDDKFITTDYLQQCLQAYLLSGDTATVRCFRGLHHFYLVLIIFTLASASQKRKFEEN